MGYILILASIDKKEYDSLNTLKSLSSSEDGVIEYFKVIKEIRVNQPFLDWFNLDFGSFSFNETFKNPTVNDLIKWINKRFNLDRKYNTGNKYKYEINPRKYAKEKILPVLKKYDLSYKIAIF